MADHIVALNLPAKPGAYCEKLLMDLCGRMVKNKLINHVPRFSTGKRNGEWFLVIECKESERLLWTGFVLGLMFARESFGTQLFNDHKDADDDFEYNCNMDSQNWDRKIDMRR